MILAKVSSSVSLSKSYQKLQEISLTTLVNHGKQCAKHFKHQPFVDVSRFRIRRVCRRSQIKIFRQVFVYFVSRISSIGTQLIQVFGQRHCKGVLFQDQEFDQINWKNQVKVQSSLSSLFSSRQKCFQL